MAYPTNYAFYGSANNGNQITLRKGTSTVSKPKLIILDRKASTYDNGRKSFSVPEMRVRTLFGVVDADGNPINKRTLMDAAFRVPVEASWTDAEEAIDDFISVVSDPGFKNQVKNLLFPTPA